MGSAERLGKRGEGRGKGEECNPFSDDPSDDVPYNGAPPPDALIIPNVNSPIDGLPQPWIQQTPITLHNADFTLRFNYATAGGTSAIPLPSALAATAVTIGLLVVPAIFLWKRNARR